jgi:hypothetical protein
MPYKDPEKRRACQKRSDRKHAARKKAQTKAWQAAHPEKMRQAARRYRLTHPDKVAALTKTRINERSKSRAEARAAKALMTERLCSICQDSKPVDAFRGQGTQCLDCRTILTKERWRRYHSTHREQQRHKSVAYRRAHPIIVKMQSVLRKARKRGAKRNTLSPAQWLEILAVFRNRCAYCGCKSTHLEPDHITPVVDFGDTHEHNIVPACRTCNLKKRTGPPLKPVQPLLLTLALPKKSKAS